MSTYQQMQRSHKGPLQSAQSRLAFLSYLTQKKEGSSHFKKKSFFWDQESLYSQNLMLRSQIKQLTEANTKAKTRILQMQQELKVKHNRNNDQNYKQTVLRSMSLRNLSRKSLNFVRSNHEEQGPTKQVRRILRQSKEQIQLLKNENTELKRSMKYTRMSELQTLNKEMEIQMQRLNRLTHDMKDKYYAITIEFQVLREQFRRETDAKIIAVKEKDKLKRELIQMKGQNSSIIKRRQVNVRAINPQARQKDSCKIEGISFNSFPKMQYSISALQKFESDTINFDKLINTESQLKSVPKISSNTSFSPQKQQKNDVSFKQAANSQEQYEFEDQEEGNKQVQQNQPNKAIDLKLKHEEKRNQEQSQSSIPKIPKQMPKSVNQEQIQQTPFQEQAYEDLMEQQFEP